jgi:hypothetical protein
MRTVSDYYYPEICERISLLPERHRATEQQKRLIDLIEDDAFASSARILQDELIEAATTPTGANEALRGFWCWLEAISAAPLPRRC